MAGKVNQVDYHLIRAARSYIFKILNTVFGIKRKQIRLRVSWRGNWCKKVLKKSYGAVVLSKWDERAPLFSVALSPKILGNEGLFKGTCAHEAIHIAYEYYRCKGRLDLFWRRVLAYLHDAIFYLEQYYESAEEFIAYILEPLVTLILFPPPASVDNEPERWSVTLPAPEDGE